MLTELPAVQEGDIVAAEEERSGDGRGHHHVGVLGHKEQGKAQAGVLGVVARYQLRLALRQIEGHAIGLGECSHPEQDEGQHARDHATLEDAPIPDGTGLICDDFAEPNTAIEHEHHDQAQAHRELIADHLSRAPQTTDERKLVVARPAREHDPVDPKRCDRQDVEQSTVDVCDLKPDHQAL